MTIEGTLVLTKVLLSRDASCAFKARNWYYNTTITLSYDKTLNIPSLTGIDVNYRGNPQPIVQQTGQIQKWVRRVLKRLGDGGKKEDSASKTLFESVWPTVLKWFRLALEKIRSAISRANPKGQDIFKTLQGFTGRGNGMFLHATGAQLFVSVTPAIARKLPQSPMETLAQKRFRRRRRGAPSGGHAAQPYTQVS